MFRPPAFPQSDPSPSTTRERNDDRVSRVVAALGPTNTGKTHLAIERMLAPCLGHDRPAAAPAGARDLRPHRARAGRARRRAGHRRGEDRPAAPALLGLHRRGDAARPRGRVRRRRRDPALRRPRARPCLHRPAAARARAGPRPCSWARRRWRRWCANSCPHAHIETRERLSTLSYAGPRQADETAQAQRRRRLLGRERLRHRRVDPPPARRRGGGDGLALAPHPQRPGGAVPVRRGRFPGRHRRDRHGPQHGPRSRRLRGLAQVRRPPHALAQPAGDRPDRRPRRALPPRRHLRGDRRGPRHRLRGRRRRRGARLRAAPGGRMAQRRARLRFARRSHALAEPAAAARRA